MPKTKPNEKCPCGSDIKYKKCCSKGDMDTRYNGEEDNFDPKVGHPISSDRVQRLSDYFMDRYSMKSIDVSDAICTLNENRIHRANAGRDVCVIAERRESNESLFIKKGDGNSDIIVIFRNNFQCFNYDTEYDAAMEAIHKALRNRK